MLRHMRTTIRLPDKLLADAKSFAARRRCTLTQVIDQSLRRTLQESERSADSSPIQLPTFRGQGLQPGVDLDDSSALLDFLEEGLNVAARR